MCKRLRTQLSEKLQRLTDLAIGYLREGERTAGDDAVVSYYLTLLQNLSHTSDHVGAAGGAIYQLGMIPDFDLFRAPDRIKGRLSRSGDALHILMVAPVFYWAVFTNSDSPTTPFRPIFTDSSRAASGLGFYLGSSYSY